MHKSIQNSFKSYPHPILGNANDIEYSTILISAKIRLNNGYQFKIIADIDDDENDYISLIENKEAYLSIYIDSPETLFTGYYKSYELETNITIPFEEICGKLDITCFIISAKNINEKIFPNQNELYEDTKFNIKKTEWLGISNTITHYIDPQFKKNLNKNNSSIFSIVQDKKNKYKGIYKALYSYDKIQIYLPRNTYEDHYYPLKDSESFFHLLLFSFIVPIIAEAINHVETEGNEEWSDLKWYVVLKEELKKDKYNDNQSLTEKAQIIFERQFRDFMKRANYYYANI